MKNHFRRVALALFAFGSVLISGHANAACRQQGDAIFSPAKGYGMNAYYISDGGNCGIGYVSFGGTSFTSAKLVTGPSNGKLNQDNRFHFVYTPSKGFAGEDQFVINVCGDYEGRNSCVNNNYTIKVDRPGGTVNADAGNKSIKQEIERQPSKVATAHRQEWNATYENVFRDKMVIRGKAVAFSGKWNRVEMSNKIWAVKWSSDTEFSFDGNRCVVAPNKVTCDGQFASGPVKGVFEKK